MQYWKNIVCLSKNAQFFGSNIDYFIGQNSENWVTKTALEVRGAIFKCFFFRVL
jgi:hypothetical protein